MGKLERPTPKKKERTDFMASRAMLQEAVRGRRLSANSWPGKRRAPRATKAMRWRIVDSRW